MRIYAWEIKLEYINNIAYQDISFRGKSYLTLLDILTLKRLFRIIFKYSNFQTAASIIGLTTFDTQGDQL